MILKILGSIIVIISTGLIGCSYAYKDYFRIEELREIKKFFNILNSEIDFAASSLPEAVFNIMQRTEGTIKNILKEFYEILNQRTGKNVCDIWTESFDKFKENTYFDSEDLQQISSFGKSLGYLDKGLQLNNIKIINDYIENKIKRLDESFNNNKKMFQSSGVLCGMLIIIILV